MKQKSFVGVVLLGFKSVWNIRFVLGTNVSEKHTVSFFSPSSPHGDTTQKTNIDILTEVRTSNLTEEFLMLI
jgi:hypothetical protein